ncbi:MAG: prepilin-type N-terminal cleavage/methylation domain-containing protein [Candidatus Eremiobacteraeota bacterium]|nr:prepilin-type N-terminal cleavage/methylation domain-containing protein [Candidatus Eremiobacteraeota bacterium]MCW5868713.1 prepilin-type N-terminal cleavage/methylation domain-containing protein [Candidatus Eremiobacteraeota bacterium]
MKQRGLTLLEVLISLGLVAIALIAIVTVFLTGLRSTRVKEQTAVATDLCRQVLERSKGLGGLPTSTMIFDGSVPTAAVGGFPPGPYPGTQVDGQQYVLRVDVKPKAGEPDVYIVHVSARWSVHRVDAESLMYAI